MTRSGTSNVLSKIERMTPSGCTNLWDGLKVGMDLLNGSNAPAKAPGTPGTAAPSANQGVWSSLRPKKSSKVSEKTSDANAAGIVHTASPSGRLSTLFILTDGMPNVVPPRGHIPMLKDYLDSHENSQNFSISTFGFGYSLESPLLLEIAQVGGGGYGFIPDSGMVGTVFVHAVANVYATYAPRAKLDVEVPEGTTVDIRGGLPVTKTSWGVQIAAGDLQFGQSLDIVLTLSQRPTKVSATLTYRSIGSTEDAKVSATLPEAPTTDLALIKYHAARLEFVGILFSVKRTALPAAVTALETLDKNITTSPTLANYPDALELAKDVSGEGILALQVANFDRWGRHYLPALARAHQRQQCGNFKDPGLQVYGRDSGVFAYERKKLDDAFMALPPPKPSVKRYDGSTAAPLKSMSRYYSSAGPCFAGDCLVTLPDGGHIRVDQLTRGMDILTLSGTGRVAAVVRSPIPSAYALLCRIGNLKVTPWHPIVSPSHKTEWVFPADIANPECMACDAVYSVLLLPPVSPVAGHDAHSISISGVWCVTLGHGLTLSDSGDVRAHAFLGDYEKVVRSLSSLEGFNEVDGVVECTGTRRDARDRTINGFVGRSVVAVKTGEHLGERFFTAVCT
jgi:hypothetical protein